MKTFEEIKTELLEQNHSRQYEVNGEVFDLTDAEFNEAIDKKAKMILTQEQDAEELKQQRLVKISGYRKLGLTDTEITALLGITEEEARLLLGGN